MEIEHKGWDWNRVEADYWNEVSEEFLPVALRWSEKYKSVLDIGAGRGRHAFFFAENGLEVDAVDLSESSIEQMKDKERESGLTVHAVQADMTRLPYEDEAFDCVICFHTVYHTGYDGVKKALGEIHRVLKKSGEAFITFNAKENPNYVREESVDGYTMIPTEGHEKGIPHCYVNEGDLFDLLADFSIISMNKTVNYVRKGKETHGIHYFVHVVKKQP